MTRLNQGFTTTELLITVAIVAILSAIAIPSYQYYIRKAYYSEIIQATMPYRISIHECLQNQGTLTGCNAGTNHIPQAITSAKGAIASLDVTNGIITVIPTKQNGIMTTDAYVLTPSLSTHKTITWLSSGGSVKNGYAK